MDGIQGAVLEVKLANIDQANKGRRRAAKRYLEALGGVEEIILPKEGSDQAHVYHIFPIRVKNRDSLLSRMGEAGVGCAIHYPVPLHLQEAYEDLGYKKGDFTISEQCASEFLSLPMYPELTEEQIDYVVDSLKNLLSVAWAN